MSRWLFGVLARVRSLAAERRVSFTGKSLRGISELELGLDAEDVCEFLSSLSPRDSAGRIRSTSTSEWLYVFRSSILENRVYVKLILRDDCVIVSFHLDEEKQNEKGE